MTEQPSMASKRHARKSHAQPLQHRPAPSKTGSTLQSEGFGKIEKLAATVIGYEIVQNLFKSLQKHGLRELYQSIAHFHNFCSRLSQTHLIHSYTYGDVMKYIEWHFQGYAISSLGQITSEADVPSLKVLFTNEVRHLLGVCGKDIALWQAKISKFVPASYHHMRVSQIEKEKALMTKLATQEAAKLPAKKEHELTTNKKAQQLLEDVTATTLVKVEKSPNAVGSGVSRSNAPLGSKYEPIILTDSSSDELDVLSREGDVAGMSQGHDGATRVCVSTSSHGPPSSSSQSVGGYPPSVPSRAPPTSLGTREVIPLPVSPFPTSPAHQGVAMEVSVETLKSMERKLESGIKHLEERLQDEVRNLEHAQPLAVESYDYGHRSTADGSLTDSVQTSDTHCPVIVKESTVIVPETPAEVPQKELVAADGGKDRQSPTSGCPKPPLSPLVVPKSKQRSLSPGEIVSPTPPSSPVFASENYFFKDSTTGVGMQGAPEKEHSGSMSHSTMRKAHPDGMVQQQGRSPSLPHSVGNWGEKSRMGGRSYARSPPHRDRSPVRRWPRSKSRSRSTSPAKRRRRRSPSPGERARTRRHAYHGYHPLRAYQHRSQSGRRSRSRSSSPSHGRRSRRSRSPSPFGRKSWTSHTHTHRRSRSRSPPAAWRSRSRGQHQASKQQLYTRSHSSEPRRQRQSEKVQLRRDTESVTSDEDLELLELRKDALISMIRDDEGTSSQGEGKEEEHRKRGKELEGDIKDTGPSQTQPVRISSQETTPSAIPTTQGKEVQDTKAQSHDKGSTSEGIARFEVSSRPPAVDHSSKLAHKKPVNGDVAPSGPPPSSAGHTEVRPPAAVASVAEPTEPAEPATATKRTNISPKTTKAVSQLAVVKHSELPVGSISTSVASSQTVTSKLLTSLRAGTPSNAVGSRASSRSGSRYSSPTRSPTPVSSPPLSRGLSRLSSEDPSRPGSPRRSSLSVKVGYN